MANMPVATLSREELLKVKSQIRRGYSSQQGRIVSVGLGQDGTHPFIRVLVTSNYPVSRLPKTVRGLPVLIRKTSAGSVALGIH